MEPANTGNGPASATALVPDGMSGIALSQRDALDLLNHAQRLVATLNADEIITKESVLDIVSPPITSSSVSTPFCRICRGFGDQIPLIECPCRCKGSMGFVHEVCLQKWHVVRKAKICEICHVKYDFPDGAPDPNFWKYIRTFFRSDCFGRIAKCLINFTALTCLAYINSKQIQILLEASREMPASMLLILYLMFTGISNFTYFEWTIHSINKIALVLERWWNRTSRYSPGEFDDLLTDIQFDEDDDQWTFISDTN